VNEPVIHPCSLRKSRPLLSLIPFDHKLEFTLHSGMLTMVRWHRITSKAIDSSIRQRRLSLICEFELYSYIASLVFFAVMPLKADSGFLSDFVSMLWLIDKTWSMRYQYDNARGCQAVDDHR
jgi:hypothetical protein